MMILVNTNNTNAGTWIPFNPNPTVNLGSGDGPKTVTFYFNCLSNIVSSYTLRIWLDTTPPAITSRRPARQHRRRAAPAIAGLRAGGIGERHL